MAELFTEKEADVNKQNSKEETPLHTALTNNSDKVTRLMWQ
jgi:ankyrin repeat protein